MGMGVVDKSLFQLDGDVEVPKAQKRLRRSGTGRFQLRDPHSGRCTPHILLFKSRT